MSRRGRAILCLLGALASVGCRRNFTKYIGAPEHGDEDTDPTVLDVAVAVLDCEDVTALAGIEKITGDLIISCPGLTALDLPLLYEIGGSLTVGPNPLLADLDGLSGLTSVWGELEITQNIVLANLNGLAGLTSVRGLLLHGNAGLTDIRGLGGLDAIGFWGYTGDLFFFVHGPVFVRNNAALPDLSGLSGLTSVGDLTISINALLTDTSGLGNIELVQGDVTFFANGSLANLDGLTSVSTIEGDLAIEDNDVLADISGLGSLRSLHQNLTVVNNVALPTCQADALISQLGGFSGTATISGNDDQGICE